MGLSQAAKYPHSTACLLVCISNVCFLIMTLTFLCDFPSFSPSSLCTLLLFFSPLHTLPPFCWGHGVFWPIPPSQSLTIAFLSCSITGAEQNRTACGLQGLCVSLSFITQHLLRTHYLRPSICLAVHPYWNQQANAFQWAPNAWICSICDKPSLSHILCGKCNSAVVGGIVLHT